MKIIYSEGYEIAGNEYLAIAINMRFGYEWDVKYFYPNMPAGYDALQRAIKWTKSLIKDDE